MTLIYSLGTAYPSCNGVTTWVSFRNFHYFSDRTIWGKN